MEFAFYAFSVCGVNGDITLAFLPGTYNQYLDLRDNDTLFGNYHLTITSSTGKATDVHFVFSQVVVVCNNTHNVTLKDITINATSGTYGIQFMGTASNITIDGCTVLANPIAFSYPNFYAGIYKESNTGSLNGLTVKNCTIDNGYYGIYLSGTINGLNIDYCQNIRIDNNNIINQSSTGIYLYYVNVKSISYNHMTPRSNSGDWHALNGFYLRNGGNITNNHVLAISSNPAAWAFYGFDLEYIDSALIANNEIYLKSSDASQTSGIFVDFPRAVSVINNSVYTIKGGTTGTANVAYRSRIYPGYSAIIKNNLFVAEGGSITSTYAFAFDGTLAYYNNYGANYEVDYNNYYSSGN
jgi:hypothetical protein